MNHPLHPALVHFPVAGWSLATAADVASLWLGEPAWRFAAISMSAGCVVALAAMAAGLWEFAKLRDGNPALPVANRLPSGDMAIAMTLTSSRAAASGMSMRAPVARSHSRMP